MRKILAVLFLASLSAFAFADDKFSLATGFDYSSGKYGGNLATDILYVPVTAKFETDSSFLKLTVPYIVVSGPGGVIRGIGLVNPAKTQSSKSTNAGFGDVVASAGHTVYSGDALSIDLVGNIKFGTADSKKGLGTGENDYSAQLDGYETLGSTTLMATAGYKVYGAPAGLTFKSAPYGMVGASEKISDPASVGIMLNAAKSPISTSGDQRDVTLYYSEKTSDHTKLQVNVLKGFAAGSPDYGFGATITGSF